MRVFRPLVGAHHVAGGRVEGGDRLAVAERDVDAVADGHQRRGISAGPLRKGRSWFSHGATGCFQSSTPLKASRATSIHFDSAFTEAIGPSSTMEKIRPAADTTALTLDR